MFLIAHAQYLSILMRLTDSCCGLICAAPAKDSGFHALEGAADGIPIRTYSLKQGVDCDLAAPYTRAV
jgi:hypothetical protein